MTAITHAILAASHNPRSMLATLVEAALSTPLRYAVRYISSPIDAGCRWAVVMLLYRKQVDLIDCYRSRREAREACRDYRREQQRDILYAMFGEDVPVI